jgi:hypothetical protein
MDNIHKLIREITEYRLDTLDKLCVLFGKLQAYREINQETIEPDLIFYGLAVGLEKITDYRIFELQDDDRLNELSNRIEEIKKREGLDTLEIFEPGDPDSPEDYQALNIEFTHRINEIAVEIMKEFDEKEMADLFTANFKEYIRRYHKGWRILEKDNQEMLQEIDESEQEELEDWL